MSWGDRSTSTEVNLKDIEDLDILLRVYILKICDALVDKIWLMKHSKNCVCWLVAIKECENKSFLNLKCLSLSLYILANSCTIVRHCLSDKMLVRSEVYGIALLVWRLQKPVREVVFGLDLQWTLWDGCFSHRSIPFMIQLTRGRRFLFQFVATYIM